MDAPLAVEIAVLLALVGLNGLLSGAEIAVVSMRAGRVAALVAEGSGAARAVRRLRDDPERFLATVQIGISVIGATAGAFGGALFAHDLEPLLRNVPGLGAHARPASLAIVVALITYFSVVGGELIPKSLALRSPERYALLIARPMVWLSQLARPVVWLLTASSNLALRPFKDQTSFLEARLSPAELQLLVDEAARSGGLDPRAGEIASRALGFAALTAANVMVPRPQVVSVERRTTTAQLRRVLLEEGHTRVPVYDGSPDRVVGYLSLKEVLALGFEPHLLVVEDVLRPAYFVPKTMRAIDLLQQMRKRRTPFAIVVDEQGGMAGIATIEDLLEELVGEIFDEHVKDAPGPLRFGSDGTALVPGTTTVRDANRALQLDLPEGGASTLAGLCLTLSGRIPLAGERLTASNGVQLEIVEASPRRVRSVRVRPKALGPEEASPSSRAGTALQPGRSR